LDAPTARQHFTFPAGQRLAAGNVQRGYFRTGALVLELRKRADRRLDASDHLAAAGRLFNEVERAIPDGLDRHRDIALPGNDEDRRGIIFRAQFPEDIES
jgi:hypothetical protein